MSYYDIYPDATINYMVCSACGTETFAWLADIFHCPVCGSGRFIYPDCIDNEVESGHKEADIQKELVKDYYEEARRRFADLRKRGGQPGNDAVMTMCGRKRKRSSSDDGGRER